MEEAPECSLIALQASMGPCHMFRGFTEGLTAFSLFAVTGFSVNLFLYFDGP